MDNVERSSKVRNATILMVLGGALQIYLSYWSFQFSIIYPHPMHIVIGTLMIVTGTLSFCVGLAIWLQKSWAATAVASIGVAVCGTLLFLGYYLIIFLFGPLYWVVIDHIRAGRVAQPLDWAEH